MSDLPPEVPVKPLRRSLRERFSIVWAIPLAALLIALGVAWTSYIERGPLMVIAFESASGVKAGETDLRYRDITVGLVEEVSFSPDLDKVEVSVRLDKSIAPYVDGDARFWVVRPEVTAQGVTGLDTVLSGVFIEGLWDATPFGFIAYHEGLTNAPLLRVGESGLQIVFRATSETALAENTPILYKGIVVGRTGKPRLVGDGTEAVADAVIYSPHDQLVSSSTRFWDISGFSFSIGAGGAELDFSSLASLISGGVTFESIVSGGLPVADGVTFDVYPDEATARASVFSDASGPPLELASIFSENVSGLAAGSPVELLGVRVGEVTSLRGFVDEERFGDARVRLLATLALRPERLGLGDAATPDEALEYLSAQVREGLRARLATASILTGGLKIELLRIADAPEALVDRSVVGPPILPSAEANIKDVAATAEGVLKRINELPIEELLVNANGFLESARTLMSNEDLQRAPGEVVGLVEDARGVLGSDAVQALPGELETLMATLQEATKDLRGVLTQLNEADAVERLLTAVDAAADTATKLGTTLDGVPGLVEKVDALATKANELPVEKLLKEATDVAESVKGLLAGDAFQALPENATALLDQLGAATGDIQAILTQVQEAGTVDGLGKALDNAAKAASGVETALEGLPELIEKIDALAAKANELPIEKLVSETTGLMQSAQDLVAADSTKALPANLNAALADLQKILAELTEKEGVSRLLAAIDEAGKAATAAGNSFEGVPALVDQISAVAAKADELPLDKLVAELTSVIESARGILGAEGANELPQSLNGALAQIENVLTELREGGTVENVNRTLASAADAANAVAQAADDLPALVTRINSLINQANSTLSSFDASSDMNKEIRAALRQVQRAADAVGSLSRALERRPNSIILGR